MSRQARVLLTLAALGAPLAAAQTVPAQTPATQLPLTLSLAQVLAQLPQAPGWRSADLQVLAARQNVQAARARAGLSASAGADASAVKAPADTGTWSSSTALSVQAGLNVLPWSPAADAVRQAERAANRAALSGRDAQNALALNVLQAYLTTRQGGAALSLATAQLNVADRQLEVARAQRAAGTLSQENLLTVQAAQQQAAAAARQAQSTLELSLRQLDTTLGLPVPAAAPQLVSRLPLPAPPAPLEVLLARAAQGRSEVQSALLGVQDAQAALDAAQLARRLPAVSVSAQYGQLAGATSAAGRTVGASLNFKTGQLGGSLSLPLQAPTTPQGGTVPSSLALGLSASFAVLDPADDAAVQAAQTSLQSAQLSLATARTSVELDVRQKDAALQNALSALSAQQTLLGRAQTGLDSARARQTAGLATALDVQQAEANVQQAQNALDSAADAAALASLSLSVATAEFSPALVAFTDAAPVNVPPPSSPPTGGQP